jgi:hypothetical protein
MYTAHWHASRHEREGTRGAAPESAQIAREARGYAFELIPRGMRLIRLMHSACYVF